MAYVWDHLEDAAGYGYDDAAANEYGGPVGQRIPGKHSLSGMIQRDADGAHGLSAGAVMAAVSSASDSSGEALPPEFRAELEAALGLSLGGVRLHTGAGSQGAARDLSARAFTVGQDIHFGRGQYQPDSQAGRRLVAHEVAHTVQQRGQAPTAQGKLEVSQPGDASEVQADAFADGFVAGRVTERPTAGALGGGRVPRHPGDEEGGAGRALGDPSVWTEESIRQAFDHNSGAGLLERVSQRDTRNGLRLLHQTGLWQRMLQEIPRGAACPANARQAMYAMVHARQVTYEEYQQLFHVRFNLEFERQLDAGYDPSTSTMPDAERQSRQRKFARPNWEVLDSIWLQLDRLPDQDVDTDHIRRIISVSVGTVGGVPAQYDTQSRDMQIDEDGGPGIPVQTDEIAASLRHEVGHAADHRVRAAGVDSVGWQQQHVREEPLTVAALRRIVDAFGGFAAASGRPAEGLANPATGANPPTDPATQERVLQRTLTWIQNGCVEDTPMPPEDPDYAAYAALPTGARESFLNRNWWDAIQHPPDPQGQRHGYVAPMGSYEARLNHYHPLVHAMTTATNRLQGSYSGVEFFAECYVEYYEHPESGRDAAHRGGSLPAPLKTWFDQNVAPQGPPRERSGARDLDPPGQGGQGQGH